MRIALTAAFAVVVVTATALAQPEKEAEPPPGGYSADKLGEALKKLGYETQPQEAGAFLITVTDGKTILYTRVSLSLDRTNLWLRTGLANLSAADKPNPEAMRRLLAENDTIGPARYTYYEPDRQVRLSRHVSNRDMTPVKLRKAIEEFDALTRRQEPVWRRDNFIRIGRVPADVAKKDLDRIQGEWRIVELWNLGVKAADENVRKANTAIRVEQSRFTAVTNGKTDTATIVVDPRGTSGRIDMISPQGRVTAGIYTLTQDTLTLCFASVEGADRPTDAEFISGPKTIRFILKRTATP